jgi:hypothetical protein
VRCTSTGRQCAYSTHSLQTILVSPYPQSHSGQRERRAFEYYFHRVGPALAGVLDLTFWNGSVLQICRLEPAVWDAVISLSTLHERPPIHDTSPFSLINNPADVRHDYHQEALVWYSRSLAALQQRINRGVADLTISMISCVIFIAIELLQGNRAAAVTLYKQGAQLLASTTSIAASDNGFALLKTTIYPMFHRLGAQFLISTDGASRDSWALNHTSMRGRFTTTNEAQNALLDLVAEWKILNKEVKADLKIFNDGNIPDVSAFADRQKCLEDCLRVWYISFNSMTPSQNPNYYPTVELSDDSTCLLLMTFISILIETQTSLVLNEMVYDEFEAEFAQILQYAPKAINATRSPDGSQPYFMLEMGIFLPLFITALKCRSPKLRRQALSFLLDAPPVQGLCMCAPVANIIATIVFIEEDLAQDGIESFADLMGSSGNIPTADKRISSLNVSSDLNNEGERENRLHFTAYVSNMEGKKWLSESSVLLPLLKDKSENR